MDGTARRHGRRTNAQFGADRAEMTASRPTTVQTTMRRREPRTAEAHGRRPAARDGIGGGITREARLTVKTGILQLFRGRTCEPPRN